jgi:histidyl-tRNA synthetase
MKLENARGVRDIEAKDQLLREYVVDTLRTIFKKYGFSPLDTPIIERYDAMSETYQLQDNGKRELGLRFDLTVPLSRYIGMNPVMKMPFKRYQIGKVYRDAPVRKGRYREFTQIDIDIIGSSDETSDATCISVALEVFRTLGIDVEIRISNRKFLSALLESYGIDENKRESVMITIDKLDKIGKEGVLKELEEKGVAERENILRDISITGSNDEKVNYYLSNKCDATGLDELKKVMSYVDDESVVFMPSLVRGLAYYTGTVFEVYAKELDSAITAGGRYDNLIGSYLDGKKEFPAVGISFGLDRIVDVMKQVNREEMQQETQVLVVPLPNTKKESFGIAQELRKAGINTDIDMMSRNVSKNLTNASKAGLPYAIIVGEDELAANVVSLKDLECGEEKKVPLSQAISIITS